MKPKALKMHFIFMMMICCLPCRAENELKELKLEPVFINKLIGNLLDFIDKNRPANGCLDYLADEMIQHKLVFVDMVEAYNNRKKINKKYGSISIRYVKNEEEVRNYLKSNPKLRRKRASILFISISSLRNGFYEVSFDANKSVMIDVILSARCGWARVEVDQSGKITKDLNTIVIIEENK
jgi:hypothetical protein